MESSALVGRQLSLLIMSDDEDEHWPVLTGIVEQRGETLILTRPEGDFALRPEWIERVRPVDPRVQVVLLGAEYVLPLRTDDLPASATPQQLHELGVRFDRKRGG
jgi:hypothetical protein